MKEFDNSILVKNLITYREINGRKQKDVANAIGIVPRTYSLYERGVQPPSINTLEKIAKYYGVTVDHFLGTLEENTETNEPLLNELKLLILNMSEKNKLKLDKITTFMSNDYRTKQK